MNFELNMDAMFRSRFRKTAELNRWFSSAVMITEDLGTHPAAGRWGSKVLRLSNSVGM